MPRYNDVNIPDELWEFFSTETGFSTEQLTHAIDKRRAINPFYSFDAFRMFVGFKGGFDLLKYYRDTPELSVDDLLQYDGYAVRDFICHDHPGLNFHHWLIDHHLKMPTQLVGSDRWSTITSLCNASGIEYLNRKIAGLPQSEWQAKLDEIIRVTPNIDADKAVVLADSLLGPHQVSWNTIDNRFLAYKSKEVEVANSVGQKVSDIQWQAAKKLSESDLTTNEKIALPEHLTAAVSAARFFNTERTKTNKTVMHHWTGRSDGLRNYQFSPKNRDSSISRVYIRINLEHRWATVGIETSQMEMYKKVMDAGRQFAVERQMDPCYFDSLHMSFRNMPKKLQDRFLSDFSMSMSFLEKPLSHGVSWRADGPDPHVEDIREAIEVLAKCDPTIAEILDYMNQEFDDENEHKPRLA